MPHRKKANHPLLEELRLKFREEMDDMSDTVLGGACKNFPEYTKGTGVIEGLALAERDLLAMDKRLEEAD